MTEEKNKGGRPTDYTPELAAEIHDLIASTPCGIRTLCKNNPGIPSHDTIYKWISKHAEFAELYAKAKVLQANLLVDEMLDIADDSSDDVLIGEDGKTHLNREFYQRGRLRIDTRKFLASKLLPKLYGDKITAEVTGANGAPIEYAELTADERKRRAMELFDAARARRASASVDAGGEGSEEMEAAGRTADSSI